MTIRFIIVTLLSISLFVANLFIGSVEIPAADVFRAIFGVAGPDDMISYIVLGSRLPQALTALLAGAGLAVAGLLLQTAMRNPLAGPSILGISSGAGLGVAIVYGDNGIAVAPVVVAEKRPHAAHRRNHDRLSHLVGDNAA